MGTRFDGPAVIALLLLAGAVHAQSVQISTPAVAVSTPEVSVSTPIAVDANALVNTSSVTVVVPSTAPATTAGSAQIGSAGTDTVPIVDAEKSFQTSAVQAMLDLAAAYSEKRRTLFMRLVSDDFLGDLGTLEDSLSSDFRSYRTIVLSVIPGFVTVHNDQASVQFSYNMTLTNDLGNNTNFSGSAAYVFKKEEGGKVRLYKMDSGAQIFGTSLSSIENPVAKSQGAAPTGTATAPTPPCGATTVQGTAQIVGNGNGFVFSNQEVTSGPGDITLEPVGGGEIEAGGGGGGGAVRPGGKDPITDLGPCSFSQLTKDPTAISQTTVPINVGDCYAIRTAAGFYAAIIVTSFNPGGGDGPPPSTMSFNYKYQPNGQTCF